MTCRPSCPGSRDLSLFYFQATACPLNYMKYLRRRFYPVPVISDKILANIDREFILNIAFDFDDLNYPSSPKQTSVPQIELYTSWWASVLYSQLQQYQGAKGGPTS